MASWGLLILLKETCGIFYKSQGSFQNILSKDKQELSVHGTPTKEAHPNIQWLILNHSKTMSVFLSNFHSLFKPLGYELKLKT